MRSSLRASGLVRTEAAIWFQPDCAQAHFGRGAILKAGRRDEAVAEYQRALQLRPWDPSAPSMLERTRAAQ
jgi:Flp pilus assembly protein TadD